MFLNAKVSEVVGVVAAIDPDAIAAGTVTSSWVSVKNFVRYALLVASGDLGAAATLDCKLQQATSAAGAGAKDITGKAITQLTQAGSGSDKQAWIDLRPEELDLDGGFTHVRISMTVATATSEAAAFLLGFAPARGPATDNDAATVVQVV